jgi:hypothetical protein
MRGYLDDQLLLETEDDQFDKPGLIGVRSKADAVTEFDDLRVATAFPKDVEEVPIPSSE